MFWRRRARQQAGGRRRGTKGAIRPLESLEARSLLTGISSHPTPLAPPTMSPPIATPAPVQLSGLAEPAPGHERLEPPPGLGRGAKAPHFYEAYTGPKLAELNAVGASAKLMRNGNFAFTGTNQGKINHAPAVYVWGLDRSGHLGPGPFTNRPNIKFDAVVIVALDTSHHLSAQVVDLASGATTDLPAGARGSAARRSA